MTTITAKSKISINSNFKVEAGPGAGKTEFLINHIKNVVYNSRRLGKVRRIACITYTNSAVGNIVERLGKGVSSSVRVSTIHSFLYKNVVKPYCSFLPKELKLDIGRFKSHQEPIVYRNHINQWIKNGDFNNLVHPNTTLQILRSSTSNQQFIALRNWLLSIYVDLDEEGTLEFKSDYKKARAVDSDENYFLFKHTNLDILQKKLLEYKKLNWQKGIVDHEDILYFSHILIERHPFILTILKAKYPYFFIDEFQDTNKIQANILKKMKEKGCIVGVIGDKAQSIYSFAGAKVNLFEDFNIDQSNSFTIKENRRSSKGIVCFLNTIRRDIRQEPSPSLKSDEEHKKENIKDVIIIEGNRNKSFNRAKEICGNEELVSLSRKNKVSNEMTGRNDNLLITETMFDEYYMKESNGKRREAIATFMQVAELANNNQIQKAIKLAERYHSNISKENLETLKRKALKNLIILMKNYPNFRSGSLFDFHHVLLHQLKLDISNFQKSSKIRGFYKNIKYEELSLIISIADDISNHITIHKAKGNEFCNVFVVSDDELKKFLLEPDLQQEEHRVRYVAVSRAKNKLFINLDKITKKERQILEEKYNCSFI